MTILYNAFLCRRQVLSLLAALAMSAAVAVHAQIYPAKPIRLITAPPGGGADFTARIIAQEISVTLGQPVIVDNRGGVLPGDLVSKARPDGYTLLLSGSGLWISSLFRKDLPYDPMKDFAPVVLAVSTSNMLVVHPSLQARSVKELIALAKASPGKFNYGSPGVGTASHLSAELFKSMAGVSIVHVPYKGTGPALNDLLGGQLQLMFVPIATVAANVKAGKLRALAVTGDRPSALAPNLPTVAASGLPGYESATILGIFVPVKTPEAIINRLNQDIVRALNKPEVKERIQGAGAEIVGGTPQEFLATRNAEMARLGKLVKEAGIKAE